MMGAIHGVAGQTALFTIGLLATERELHVVRGPVKRGWLIPATALVALTGVIMFVSEDPIASWRIGPVPVAAIFMLLLLAWLVWELTGASKAKAKTWALFERVLESGEPDESSLSALRAGRGASVQAVKEVKNLKFDSGTHVLRARLPAVKIRIAPDDVARAEDLAAFIAGLSPSQ